MQPRQMYGLGSLVKKAVKGVKNVIKSPIGKAAILGAVGFGLPGGSGGLFGKGAFGKLIGALPSRLGPQVTSGSGLLGLLGKAKTGFANLSTAGKIFAGGGAAFTLANMFPQQEGEDDNTYAERLKRLEPLMNRYYSNVNPNASAAEVKKFIQDNTQEYRAMGGRVGYRLGGDTMDRDGIKSLEAGAPDVRYKGDMQMASETGPEEFEMDMLMELTQAFEEAKRQGFRGDFKSFLEMYLGDSARAPEGIMQEAPMQMAANGGRIGFQSGTNTVMGDIAMSKPSETFEGMGQNIMDILKRLPPALLEVIMNIKDSDKNNLLERLKLPEEKANGGRIGLMKGAMPVDEDEEDSYRAGVMQAMMQNRKKAMGGGMMQIPMGKIRMNEGGVIERDYRDKGGFVPVGIKEKADDVPAMLSKNEFVMTADAVRGAGGGSIEKGAQRMYDTMKSLERKIG
jgi:hypothetical protein